ncbi:hypothetical protein BS47DRAFT_50058 [Hydnum rufescens UP504]|uniref:Uncharacterized protein n=1 Tax=Hydnum rufescens UP504 TaxID=1448309 RepID=A0A9P6ARL2_9AGAM|nr:hypothetical protein BS47DRAFT_50058 [Hydnum rufescens UP504]
MVMYKNSILDVPERLEDEIPGLNSGDNETTALQSSLGAIASSERVEHDPFPINSRDHERTDLKYSRRTITVPQQQPDEHLPFLSDDPVTTDSRPSLQRMTLPERLEGDGLMNSGDPENFQNSLGNDNPTAASRRRYSSQFWGLRDDRFTAGGDSIVRATRRRTISSIPGTTRVADLLYSMQTTSLPQGKEDEHLPLNSEVLETTDSHIFQQTTTLPERLEDDDFLINSGNHENL